MTTALCKLHKNNLKYNIIFNYELDMEKLTMKQFLEIQSFNDSKDDLNINEDAKEIMNTYEVWCISVFLV